MATVGLAGAEYGKTETLCFLFSLHSKLQDFWPGLKLIIWAIEDTIDEIESREQPR